MIRSAISAACALILAAAPPAFAQPEQDKSPEPLVLALPATTEACLEMMEAVIDRATEADMLDDQVDKAEAELDMMEAHCHEKRFAEALESAKAVMTLVAANK